MPNFRILPLPHMAQPKRKPLPQKRKTESVGIYFGGSDAEFFQQLKADADSYSMDLSTYAKRLLRIGKKVVDKDPMLLLTGVK
jgi:hypothetical protein